MASNIIHSKDFSTILNLSPDRKDWQEICNDATAQRAVKLAQEILSQLQPLDYKSDSIDTFIQKLDLLNHKYIEFTKGSPLSSEIQRLKEKQSEACGSATKVKAHFTCTYPEKKEVGSSSNTSMNPQEKLYKQFQEKIQQLELTSPSRTQQIEEIKQILSQLEKLKVFPKEEAFAISGMLDALKKGDTFLFHLPGDSLIALLAELYPKLQIDLDRYHEAKKVSQEQAQSELLKIFKTRCSSPKQLSQSLQPAYNQLLSQSYQTRLTFALGEQRLKSTYFNQYFILNFPKLAVLFEQFTYKIAPKVLNQEIDQITKTWDERSAGKFSQLIKSYSYLNMNKKYSDFIEFSQNNFIKTLDLKEINQTEPQKIDHLISLYQDCLEKIGLKSFHYIYDEKFKSRHEWLAKNAESIKKPYNQADDQELSAGCCFNNSIDRHWILSTLPDIPGKDIPMKSSKEGRFAQARAVQAFRLMRQAKMSYEEAEEIQLSAAKRHGLIQRQTIPVNPSAQKDSQSKLHLIDGMTKIYHEKKSAQFILTLYNPNAHAINIQLDAPHNLYRFIDDNLGVCEFTSFEEFQMEFLSYLQAFHPRKIQFIMRFFEKE